MVTANWVKCGTQGDRWCPLETVVLDKVDTYGVYLIWQDVSGQVLYVGQGSIKDRLMEHRQNPSFLEHRGEGRLLVTWISEGDESRRRGIESYLLNAFKPLLNIQMPSVPGIAVNLPTS